MCLPRVGEAWSEDVGGCGGGRVERHGQVLPWLRRLLASVFSVAEAPCLKQIFARSLPMRPGVGPHGGGRAGEESRSQCGAQGKLEGRSLQDFPAHQEPAASLYGGPGSLGGTAGGLGAAKVNARAGSATIADRHAERVPMCTHIYTAAYLRPGPHSHSWTHFMLILVHKP